MADQDGLEIGGISNKGLFFPIMSFEKGKLFPISAYFIRYYVSIGS